MNAESEGKMKPSELLAILIVGGAIVLATIRANQKPSTPERPALPKIGNALPPNPATSLAPPANTLRLGREDGTLLLIPAPAGMVQMDPEPASAFRAACPPGSQVLAVFVSEEQQRTRSAVRHYAVVTEPARTIVKTAGVFERDKPVIRSLNLRDVDPMTTELSDGKPISAFIAEMGVDDTSAFSLGEIGDGPGWIAFGMVAQSVADGEPFASAFSHTYVLLRGRVHMVYYYDSLDGAMNTKLLRERTAAWVHDLLRLNPT